MDMILIALMVLVICGMAFIAFRLMNPAFPRSSQQELIESLQIEKTRLATELEHEKRLATEKQELLIASEERLKKEFENLANRIFEDKGRDLTEQNRERLNGLLQPLKEQLDSFRKRVDEVHQQDTTQSARLFEQVRQLQELSNRVSEEANHLAQAIKGDAKAQGDWGELIIERIFEASGLAPGREYHVQESFRDDDGNLKRPDFVVFLPGEKAVIVDAKVSLKAFEEYVNAEDSAVQQAALTAHIRSVRRHVDDLRGKNYTALLGNRTLDFVIMCIPLEPAYQTALKHDDKLLYDLAQTPVVLTGPATLMITLKLIAQVWRRENENKNAERIADRAGKLYDQVALIADAMEDAQRKLSGTATAFDLAIKRLKDGKGNLVGRVEELRKLGAKVSKTLPASSTPAEETEEESL